MLFSFFKRLVPGIKSRLVKENHERFIIGRKLSQNQRPPVFLRE
jgi:hypothetical protein